jgi:hypothetical protein
MMMKPSRIRRNEFDELKMCRVNFDGEVYLIEEARYHPDSG